MGGKGKKQSGGEHKLPANKRKKSPDGYYKSVDDPSYDIKTSRVVVKKTTPKGEIPFDSVVLAMLAKQYIVASKKKNK
jgi:hypothetical protein